MKNKIFIQYSFIVFIVFNLLFWTSCEKEQIINQNNGSSQDSIEFNGIMYDSLTGLNTNQATLFDLRDSFLYPVLNIGSELWMVENLRFKASGSWENSSNPSILYGRLYDWYTVMNGANPSSSTPSGVRGICPLGWHVPSDLEWHTFEIAVGMSSSIYSGQFSWRGTHGEGMKSTTGWSNGGNGTNSSGFNALPVGYISGNQYYYLGFVTSFWSTTENIHSTASAWTRYLYYDEIGGGRGLLNKIDGYSCRCLKD